VTVPVVAAPFLGSALVLVAAGGAKVIRPEDTARALHVAGWRVDRNVVRAGAVGEALVGLAAIAFPGPLTGGLVAASYLAFSCFVVVAVRRGWPLSSCGCFGRPDSQPSYQHATLNAAAAAIAIWWSAAAPTGLRSVVSHQPWHGVPLLFTVLVIAGLAYAVWTNPVGRPAR
jgi:Methylamine utilisation protein MauE